MVITSENSIATKEDLQYKCKGAYIMNPEKTYCPTREEIEASCKIIKISDAYNINECVEYNDVLLSKQLYIYVIVHNSKNTSANLGGRDDSYAKLQISTDKSSWTDVAKVATSDIGKGKVKTFTISADLSAAKIGSSYIDLGSTQYYFRITCGQTGMNQTWKYSINDTDTYTKCDSDNTKIGYTPAYPVQQTSISSLSLIGKSDIHTVHFDIS